MDVLDQLAKTIADIYKKNRNPPSTAPRIGIVVESEPLKIKWGDNVIITQDKLIVPQLYTAGYEIPNRWQDPHGNIVDDTLIWRVELKPSDQVMIAPDEALKTWYLLCKI
ncbi:DUF2577 family protein [Paenibacillus sp. 32O-W]|uniref:DUF2577 family protein n=1 Tax=Paenibacillus sp. 32O-W TaxID=1695218 RepID=UPI0011AB0A05|nr:DUF2577 family protein [Paenibacillus sp. 32O-W]